MIDQVIIRTNSEEKSLIPDKWVLGNGLSTDGLYVIHTDSPFMIVQFSPSVLVGKTNQSPCVVYLNGDISPDIFNRLFAEAWKLMEIQKARTNPRPPTGEL